MTTITANGDTDAIYLYDPVSGPGIQYSINNDPILTLITSWPCTIVNTSTSNNYLVINFPAVSNPSIRIRAADNYFICGSEYIQFGSTSLASDGNLYYIRFDPSYPDEAYLGLIENGTALGSGKNNITIYNLYAYMTNNTMATGGGGIGRPYYARAATNNTITNSGSQGFIASSGGGVVGSYAAIGGGNLTLTVCQTYGEIDSNSGGIIGASCATNTDSVIMLDRCISSGVIGSSGGGMTGNSCALWGGSVTCTNCLSTGSNTAGGGGIFGVTNGYGTGGTATAINCYSTGAIAGGAGGIFSQNAGINDGTAHATNCYALGNIGPSSGGIFGANYGLAYANHCYTTGTITGGVGGIWAGSPAESAVDSGSNYSEGQHASSGWNDLNANATLTGVPDETNYGTTWFRGGAINTRYGLSLSKYSPYSLEPVDTFEETVTAGNSTSAPANPLYNVYKIITAVFAIAVTGITINPTTGVITVSPSTPPGTYTVYVYSEYFGYSITTYTLTVLPEPTSATIPVETGTSCCVTEYAITGQNYDVINNLASGNVMMTQYRTRPNVQFVDYSFYYQFRAAQQNTYGRYKCNNSG